MSPPTLTLVESATERVKIARERFETAKLAALGALQAWADLRKHGIRVPEVLERGMMEASEAVEARLDEYTTACREAVDEQMRVRS